MASKKIFLSREDIEKMEDVCDRTAKDRMKKYLEMVGKKWGQTLTVFEYAAIKDCTVEVVCCTRNINTDHWNWALYNRIMDKIRVKIERIKNKKKNK
jgi:hypothetical protein